MVKKISKVPVFIEWLDHWSFTGGKWRPIEDAETGLLTCHTIGWVVKEDRASIFVASTFSLGKEERIHNFDGSICIAKKLIVKRINLKGVK